tara:strand:+ start:2322 stop:3476 length:1155 start_codon:yes stop_codon:yes gene_type:complete
VENYIKNLLPFIKYSIVGIIGTAVDIGSLYILVDYFAFGVIFASSISFILAVVNNFILNKIWTFENKSKNYRKLFIKFLIVSIIGLGLTLISMQILVFTFKIWYLFAKAITSIIVMLWNFLANKFWTFKTKDFKNFKTQDFKYDLSIILPCYNEEKRIESTFKIIDKYIKDNNLKSEIIFVNDGSTDNTQKLINNFCKNSPTYKNIELSINQGKGYAVKKGVLNSNGKYILFTDSDNSTPISELPKLMHVLDKKNIDICIGSRYLDNKTVKIKQPFYRIIISRLGNFLISLLLIDGIKDTQCGFKLFKSNVAKEIFEMQKVKRFGFDMEVLIIAKHYGFKIKEVPVSWINSEDSRFRLIKDSFITLKDLLYIKLNLITGRYNKY